MQSDYQRDSYRLCILCCCCVAFQVFSSEATFSAANECLQIMGGLGYLKNYPYERHVRDARVLSIYEVCVLIVCVLIMCSGTSALVINKLGISRIIIYTRCRIAIVPYM